jgi:hypothetical protein
MNKSLKKLVISVSTVALLATGAVTTPANAESPLVITVSKTTNLALAGESVTVSITGIPEGQGVYVYQCASAVADPRPDSTRCRTRMADSLWLTTAGGRGAGIAGQQNQFSLLKEFSNEGPTINCSIDACGIFVRRDHVDPSDTSLDKIVPISFVAAKATQTVPAIRNSVKVGKFISFKKTTSAGLLMAATTSTPKICSVAIKGANFKVTGKKAGTCKLTLSQRGSATANPLRATVKSIRVTS